MATYRVQGPDGATYRIEGPDGATDEQLISAVQDQIAQGLKEEEKKPEEIVSPTYEGGLQEFGEGVVSGLIAIPQGIAELGASVIDLAADTNLSQSVTETADEIRTQLGVDPEGLAGKLTETVTQFVLPGLGAASAVSKVSKLGKLARTGTNLSKSQKVGLLGQQVAAAGLADAAVSTDGITTIGDFFEGGFTETDRTVGLDGRDEALRRIGNKFKVGAETSLIVGSLPTVFKGVREGLKGTTALTRAVGDTTGLSEPVGNVVGRVAETLKKPIEAGQKIIKDAEERVVFRADEASLADNMIVGINRALGYRGVLPQDVADFRANIPLQTGEELRTATLNFNRIEQDLDKVIKEFNEQLGDQASGLTRQSFYDNIFDFMTSGKNIEDYASIPASKRADVVAAREHLTKLSKDVLKSDILTNLKKIDSITKGRFEGKTGEEAYNIISKEFENNFNKYLRRRYRIFEAKKGTFKPGDQEVEEAITGYLNDKNMLGSELREFVNNPRVNTTGKTFADLGIDDAGNLLGTPTREQAETAVKGFLGRYGYGVRKLGEGKGFGRIQDQAIDHTLFTERVQLTDYQKKLIGEIKDPVEAYFGTVSDLSSFMATDRYFRNIRNMVESNPNGSIAKFFSNASEAPTGYKTLRGRSSDESPILTSYGSLEGFHVPPKVKDDLDRFIIGDIGTIGNAARQFYGNYFLRAKGATQYAKTVLSPVTQIRNFTTATLFATMQGNIGKGANLLESVKIAFSDLKNLPTEEAVSKLKEYDRLGLLGTQPEIQEIKKLIDEGFGFQGSNEVINGQRVGREFGSRFTDNTFGNFLNKKVLKKLEKAYQASDNSFKIYNFEFEKTKLNNVLTGASTEDKLNYFTRVLGQDKVNALRVGDDGVNLTNDQLVGRLLNERSADIVKNTVPNYNLTPEFIKGLRKLPFGNFVSFPYEIIRTSGNTIKLALDEMADPLTQNIGLRRMSGTLFTLGAVPYATTQLAYKLSGVSPEEMEAYQRSFAPPWEKNARLIPVGRTEDGKILYNNFSYFTPYGDLEKIAMGAFNKFDEVRNEGGGFDKAIFQGFFESFGELLKPYTEEAIIFAKLRDVADPESENILTKVFGRVVGGRGGSTELGARVYNEQDSIGDKMAKSFKHILDGFMPGAVPFNVRGGEFVSGDFTRSIFGGHLGITEKDRLGRQPKLYREFYGALLGGTNEMDPELALKFKGYEFSEARKNASSIFNSVARRANVSRDEIIDAYEKGNEARFRVFNEFYAIVQDLKRLGKSEREIIKLFRQNGVTGIKELVRGDFEPLPNIATTVKRAMRREGTIGEYPKEQISKFIQEQRKRKFTATSVDKKDQAPVEEKPRPIPFTRTKPPVTTAPVQTGNINTGQQINTSLASLLGGNPIEAAKNMEILQRRNQ
jgi:hypothetical protein